MGSSTFAMRTAVILLLLCVYGSHSQDFTMGSLNHTLTFMKIGTNAAHPFEPKVDDIYYSDPGHKDIKGLKLEDLEGKDAEAKILAGGVGFHFVNMTLKSKPGESLNYQLEIYS